MRRVKTATAWAFRLYNFDGLCRWAAPDKERLWATLPKLCHGPKNYIPTAVRMVPERDYRLLLAVVRAAEKFYDVAYAAREQVVINEVCKALDAFNAKPRKPR